MVRRSERGEIVVNIDDLQVGDRVEIVREWHALSGQNGSGRMDKYLGTVMTVREVCIDEESIRMEEDAEDGFGNGWVWNKYCINRIVDDDDIFEFDEDELSDFFRIGG